MYHRDVYFIKSGRHIIRDYCLYQKNTVTGNKWKISPLVELQEMTRKGKRRGMHGCDSSGLRLHSRIVQSSLGLIDIVIHHKSHKFMKDLDAKA